MSDSCSFARAITDFWTNDTDELSCTTNDILRIIYKENRKTVFAKNLSTGLSGKLPSYCLEPFEIPVLVDSSAQIIFVAVKDFAGSENGDLSFGKGSVITGDRAVDANWWYGWIGDRHGIFPLEWVRDVSQDVLQERSNGFFSSQPITSDVSYSETAITTKINGSSQAPIPDLLSNHMVSSIMTPAPDVSVITCPHGRALYDFHTGLTNELSFKAGDVVLLHNYVDPNWLEGELPNGQRGIFPKDFITIIVDVPDGNAINDDEIANHFQSDEEFEDFPPDTYAIALSDHIGQNANELRLKSGDAVTILRKRGQDWVEAMDDYGNVGFCAASCLEIIGTEPDEIRSSSQLDSSSGSSFRSSRSMASPTFSMGSGDASSYSADKRSSWHGSDYELRTVESTGASLNSDSANTMDKGYRSSRTKVIDEIIASEKDYIESLVVCMDILRKDSPPEIFDCKTVFGTIDDVLSVAKDLLHDLTFARNNDGQIGEAFLRNIPALKRAYMTYCQNNDATIGLLCQYKDIALLDEYMKRKVAEIRLRINCFDLASMFIKPLQRVLKYPLLLSELLKATDKSHSDYVFVRECMKHSTDIASGINELKRRKELVAKYRDHSDASFSERLSRFSFHSVVKKSSRIGLLVSSTIGLTTLMQDPTFQAAERRFQITKRTIKWFLRNVAEFVEQLRNLLPILTSIAEDFALLLKNRPDGVADAFSGSQEAISKQIIHEFVPKIKVHVVHPLEETLNQFSGPVKLISKRHAKLIDYENAKRKIDRIKDGQRTQAMLDELDLAKKVYQALNSQLVEELPKFNEATANILRTRVDGFLHFRKLFFYACSSAILPCVKAVSASGRKGSEKSLAQNLETVICELKKLDYGSAIRIPEMGTINPVENGGVFVADSTSTNFHREPGIDVASVDLSSGNFRRSNSVPAGHSQSRAVPVAAAPPVPARSSIPPRSPGLRFRVIKEYQPKDSFDLSVRPGDVVDVIKQHTPMGNSDRWYIQHKGKTGFVPQNILKPFDALDNADYAFFEEGKIMPFSSGVAALLNDLKPVESQCVAAFAFVPYGPHQLPLKQGDRVTVMAAHDLDGNTEWSYVENCFGARGYVPTTYLKRFVGMTSQ
ncbi:dynamin-binding protein-like isoform X2 [Paramacrobiotus metropolitanus]|uniref:dynamin-binding protein-like isoform X2 n=1 Tax=Paramacrobiotus metropolitanus TaxID=2943436 RepID=UPI002445A72B|nr:dynamin-binding protein-like isoform X2 [Paramacrobiotus metropolitanus]